MQSIGKYIYASEKASIYMLSCHNKHQNAVNLALQTQEKDQWIFFRYRTSVDVNSRNNFTNLGFFANVFVPVEFIIPCTHILRKRSCYNFTLTGEYNS